jgi:hypothetical protein
MSLQGRVAPQVFGSVGFSLLTDFATEARVPTRFVRAADLVEVPVSGGTLKPTAARCRKVKNPDVFQYLILYRIVQIANVVEILRFWHGAGAGSIRVRS